MSSTKIRHICPTVHPSVRMEQLDSHRKDFREIWYLEKLLKKSKFHWNPTRIAGTSLADQYKFLILCHSVILRRINVLGKLCGENRNTDFMRNNFFFKSCNLRDMLKNIEERWSPQMTIWRMHIACWISEATNTHIGCVIITAFHSNNCLKNAPHC